MSTTFLTSTNHHEKLPKFINRLAAFVRSKGITSGEYNLQDLHDFPQTSTLYSGYKVIITSRTVSLKDDNSKFTLDLADSIHHTFV